MALGETKTIEAIYILVMGVSWQWGYSKSIFISTMNYQNSFNEKQKQSTSLNPINNCSLTIKL